MKWEGEIKNFIVTGDTHGEVSRIEKFANEFDVESNALIILGDAGFNFYLNKTDRKRKEEVQGFNCLVYCVRGNHEERPENISTMIEKYDDVVKGYVYCEEEYPNIRYFKDGGIYDLCGYTTLVIGGAYSVDKNYRLARAQARFGDNWTEHWTGWFKDEQLTAEEMFKIQNDVKDMRFDFVLSHTCPYTWQPFNLFLNGINQNTVDNTMERWLDTLKNEISWNYAWLFGHFHDNAIIRPHVEMYYDNSYSLVHIANRWEDWEHGYRLPWYMNLNFVTYPFWNEDNAKRQLPTHRKDAICFYFTDEGEENGR